MSKANRAKATEDLNAELKKYVEDVKKAITSKVTQVGTENVVPAYAERFTLEELRELAAFFKSPTIKKYQEAAPELGSLFVKKLVETVSPDEAERAKQFNEAAAKIVGSTPAPKTTGKAPAKK